MENNCHLLIIFCFDYSGKILNLFTFIFKERMIGNQQSISNSFLSHKNCVLLGNAFAVLPIGRKMTFSLCVCTCVKKTRLLDESKCVIDSLVNRIVIFFMIICSLNKNLQMFTTHTRGVCVPEFFKYFNTRNFGKVKTLLMNH